MFAKVLVANRGEIAVRAFRAAYELGAQTVAVFPYEDRNAVHRIKADEAYQIGERGHPVRAYLDIDEIIRAAKQSGADAIYPGYGFLSENPDLARACCRGRHHLHRSAGRRAGAGRQQGPGACRRPRAAGIPTLRSTPPSADLDELVAGAEEIGFPVFVKAVAGGGGRGMRRVDDPKDAARVAGGGHARGRGRLRRPDRVHRAGRAAGRGTSRCRSWPTRRATSCTCSSGTARSSAGTRRSIEIAPAPHISDELRAGAVRRCGEVRRVARLLLCRHGRVPGRDRGRAGRASTSSSR